MLTLFIWLIAYAIPALSADALVKLLPKEKRGFHIRNTVIMHGVLLLSVLMSQYAIYRLGYTFPWELNVLSIGLYLVAVACAYGIIRKLGFWYGLSSLLQELSLLSIAFLLLSEYTFVVVVALIVPIFSFSHLLHAKHWLIRLVLIALWGVASVGLFTLLHNIWIIAALHSLLGAFFIKKEILYTSVHYRRKK